MSVAGSDGNVVQTNNFMADPTTIKDPFNSDSYYLDGRSSEEVSNLTTPTSSHFIIEYISSTQYFNIALMQEPIGPVRGEMERYLMTKLGLTQNQMCQLNYMVSVPNRVNSQYSGINLGFSFCPGAVVLPH